MSETKTLEILCDLADALEAAAVKLKHEVAELQGIQKEPQNQDFSKLVWEDKQGEKGPFQQTSEKSNQNSILWQQLKVKLKEHSGFWQNQGFKFWFDMQNENVIDRRRIG